MCVCVDLCVPLLMGGQRRNLTSIRLSRGALSPILAQRPHKEQYPREPTRLEERMDIRSQE